MTDHDGFSGTSVLRWPPWVLTAWPEVTPLHFDRLFKSGHMLAICYLVFVYVRVGSRPHCAIGRDALCIAPRDKKASPDL